MAEGESRSASKDEIFQGRSKLATAGVAASVEQEQEAKVLVLYTGGTIGMRTNRSGGKIWNMTEFLVFLNTKDDSSHTNYIGQRHQMLGRIELIL